MRCIVVTVDHTPQSRGAYADIRICSGNWTPRDTVRFYARLGLLQPKASGKGGRHPYSVFTDKDIQVAEVIRIAQSLGMSLKEIAAFNEERRKGHLTHRRRVEIMSAQLV